jgi:hypothetical protein
MMFLDVPFAFCVMAHDDGRAVNQLAVVNDPVGL